MPFAGLRSPVLFLRAVLRIAPLAGKKLVEGHGAPRGPARQGDEDGSDRAFVRGVRGVEGSAARGRGHRVRACGGDGARRDVPDDAGGGVEPPAVAGLRLPAGDAGGTGPRWRRDAGSAGCLEPGGRGRGGPALRGLRPADAVRRNVPDAGVPVCVDLLRPLREAADRESARYGRVIPDDDQYFVVHRVPPRGGDGGHDAILSFTLCDDIRERIERGEEV